MFLHHFTLFSAGSSVCISSCRRIITAAPGCQRSHVSMVTGGGVKPRSRLIKVAASSCSGCDWLELQQQQTAVRLMRGQTPLWFGVFTAPPTNPSTAAP